MVKKVPMRSCVLTREQLPKKDLIRIVRTPEQDVVVDLKGKANGRGAYLKADIEVINKAQKIKILDRKLEVKVNDEVYDELRKIVGDLSA
ncbi:MAG: YlxR family protein [bacterium]